MSLKKMYMKHIKDTELDILIQPTCDLDGIGVVPQSKINDIIELAHNLPKLPCTNKIVFDTIPQIS